MLELSMHILDLAQNALAAGATLVEISIREDLPNDLLTIEVKDDGRGMSADLVRRVTDPFTTSRTTREVGLGLSLLKEAAERCVGHLTVQSEEGRGTRVTAAFRLDHFDRAPLGEMGETLAILVTGNPEVDFTYRHEVDGKLYRLETREMREILGPVGLEETLVLSFIKQDVNEGLRKIGAATFPKTMEVLR